MEKTIEELAVKGVCKKCGGEYGVIGLDVLELCVKCIDGACGEDGDK